MTSRYFVFTDTAALYALAPAAFTARTRYQYVFARPTVLSANVVLFAARETSVENDVPFPER